MLGLVKSYLGPETRKRDMKRRLADLDLTNQRSTQLRSISVSHSRAVPAAENNTRIGFARSMAKPGARAYNGGLGAGIQGAEPLVGGQGAKPPAADGILVLEHSFLRSPGGFLHSCNL